MHCGVMGVVVFITNEKSAEMFTDRCAFVCAPVHDELRSPLSVEEQTSSDQLEEPKKNTSSPLPSDSQLIWERSAFTAVNISTHKRRRLLLTLFTTDSGSCCGGTDNSSSN